MTRPKHPNRNGTDQARDRLAVLIGELAPGARTTPRSPTEPTPIFRWPNTSPDDDLQDTIIDVDLPTRRRNGERPPTQGPPIGTGPTATRQFDDWLTEKTPNTIGSAAEFSAIDPASGDPPLSAPTAFDHRAGEPTGLGGQLVERWLPGGNRAIDGARSLVRKHRGPVLVVVLLALAAAIGTAIAMASSRPTVESAPALPPAVSAMANSSAAPSRSANTRIVVSVVGKVSNPGLVTLADGSRVADAVRAAGGVLPGTDVTTLNLARKLADGEQIYVGIPVPAGLAEPEPETESAPDPAVDNAPSSGVGDSSGSTPAKKSKKGKNSANLTPGEKVNLNTASAAELETLPGVGDATAQRIVDWRSQHGSFNSIDQLRDVGGIGDGKFGKLKDLVTV